MKTEDLIVQLAGQAHPVHILPPPSVRFVQWTLAMMPIAVIGLLAFGARGDVFSAVRLPAFLARAVTTMLTALVAAASAFRLSIPDAERSRIDYFMPFAALSTWTLLSLVLLTSGGDPWARILALPINWPCGMKITSLSIVPGWVLFAMLRRAAPLQRTWNAAIASLAAVALAATATQFSCPVDDPAHQLVGHVLPVMFLCALGTALGYGSLDWFPRRLMQKAEPTGT